MCTYKPTFPTSHVCCNRVLHYIILILYASMYSEHPWILANTLMVDTMHQCAFHVHACEGIDSAI